MSDFTVRSDSISVEQIMDQIRARIREKRGADYTEDQIRELAAVKLEKFLDPRGVRSDLLEQFKRARPAYQPPDLPNYAFEEQTLFDSHRGVLRLIRRLLAPVLKLLFNPNPLIQALNIQSRLNTSMAEREARREAERHAFDQLYYELVHNLVRETTRLNIEVKNLKMRIESLTSRLEFNERRARSLESVVVYRESEGPGEAPPRPSQTESTAPPRDGGAVDSGRPPAPGMPSEGPGQRSRRRRRRRGRRGTGSVAAMMGAPAGPAAPQSAAPEAAPWTGDRDAEQANPTESESDSNEGPDAGDLGDPGDPGNVDPSDQEQ
jgi:hypothetical protein